MAITAIFVLLIALGVLANRYGYASRPRPRAAEEYLADAGFTWDECLAAPRRTNTPSAPVREAQRDRRRLAAGPREAGFSKETRAMHARQQPRDRLAQEAARR